MNVGLLTLRIIQHEDVCIFIYSSLSATCFGLQLRPSSGSAAVMQKGKIEVEASPLL